ncbi:MAG: branched-chain amino acid ABC transporter permease [Deltaproteobacteria bacterium]|nr:branched-chain amino acid ABC transporter permease [Deltaproteobacteria bacterium]
MGFFLQLLANGISLGFLYALSALGFVMIFKSSNVLNFAHGALMTIGAFLFLALSAWAGLPIILAFALTLAGSFTLGFLLEKFFLRPLIKKTIIYVIMLTLGLALMFRGLLTFIFGGDIHSYPKFLPETLSLKWGGIEISAVYVAAFIIGAVSLILFGLFYKYSSQGIYMRSVADNKPAALSIGVHIRRGFALSWAIAALVCAISGVLFGIINGVSVNALNSIGFKMLPIVILGGLGSIRGAILGGVTIGLLETFTGAYISLSLQEIMPYIVLVFILMVKPYGLFGLVETKRA